MIMELIQNYPVNDVPIRLLNNLNSDIIKILDIFMNWK